ncbi:methionine ABC transporter ATP-binding protein [Shimazuella sp. AN120528]|uniref:methionine ABC transporter ATP-binding protein n=1 Tax=Shimazuella soli TaxID=1892854 RepID=UPI001F0F600D|nr:methionine ABC transporter ATP-binding protein [Shimazuella soli]MCH5586208.1 methionine ABC transporter ATP-binding protein [Shimazuella soli]
MIELKNISKIYPGSPPVEALKEVSLHIEKGEIYGVVGVSGAGKSSLIRSVNLLEEPTTGEVMVDGVLLSSLSSEELRKARRKIGMIFQQFNLLESKTVFHNVALPLYLVGKKRKEVEEKVMQLLTFVGLADRAEHYPGQLSGGQKQRVGIARALATDPHILLCDEATSALDPDTTKSVLDLLRKVNKDYGITILLITHEMDVVRNLCDRVAVIDQGRIVEQGTVYEVFTNPKSETAQRFVRTIFGQELPESVHQSLEKQDQILRIVFTGENAKRPLIAEVIRKFQTDINILQGSITELQGKPFGDLLISIQGDRKVTENIIQYLQEHQVLVKEVASIGV